MYSCYIDIETVFPSPSTNFIFYPQFQKVTYHSRDFPVIFTKYFNNHENSL